jgi:hypothetical protein
LDGRIIGILNEFGPAPETLGAGIDGGSDFKAGVLVEQDPIEDVAFASAVLSDDGHDAEMFLLVGFHEPADGLMVDDDF